MAESCEKIRVERGRKGRFRALLRDESGDIELVWFGRAFLYRTMLDVGERIDRHRQGGHACSFANGPPGCRPHCRRGEKSAFPAIPLYPAHRAHARGGNQPPAAFQGNPLGAGRRCSDSPGRFPKSIEAKAPISAAGTVPARNPSARRSWHRLTDIRNVCAMRSSSTLRSPLRWSRRKFALPGRPMDPGDLPARFRESTAVHPYRRTGIRRSARSTRMPAPRAGCTGFCTAMWGAAKRWLRFSPVSRRLPRIPGRLARAHRSACPADLAANRGMACSRSDFMRSFSLAQRNPRRNAGLRKGFESAPSGSSSEPMRCCSRQ